jgi:CRP-like cAMP-binding protein
MDRISQFAISDGSGAKLATTKINPTLRSYIKGDAIFVDGQPAVSFYKIIAGAVRSYNF